MDKVAKAHNRWPKRKKTRFQTAGDSVTAIAVARSEGKLDVDTYKK